jgi:hypothetical protein
MRSPSAIAARLNWFSDKQLALPNLTLRVLVTQHQSASPWRKTIGRQPQADGALACKRSHYQGHGRCREVKLAGDAERCFQRLKRKRKIEEPLSQTDFRGPMDPRGDGLLVNSLLQDCPDIGHKMCSLAHFVRTQGALEKVRFEAGGLVS